MVEAIGPDTEGGDFFPDHKKRFQTLNDQASPLWDAKCVLIMRKGGVDKIRFRFYDENKGDSGKSDELLMEFAVPRSELPEAGRPRGGLRVGGMI